MNITQLNDINYLKELANNQEDLINVIKESRGYVLHVMEKNEIFPPKNFLADNLTPFSIFFFIENYDLARKDIKEIRKHFVSDAQNKVAQDNLTQEEINEYLEEGRMLPLTTILSLDTIKKYPDEIDNLFDNNEYDIKKILKRSIKLLNKEEFLSINEKFLKSNVYLFNSLPIYFKDRDFKEKYKKLILQIYKKENEKPTFRQFSSYQFDKEDLPLFNQLLQQVNKRFSSTSYNELISIKGFTELTNKIDFFTNYNSKDITLFNDSELLENQQIIRKTIITKIENKRYDVFNSIMNISASFDQFKFIVNGEFFKDFVSAVDNINYRDVDRDNSDGKQRFKHLQLLYLDFAVNNYQIKKYHYKIDPVEVVKIIQDFADNYEMRNDEKFIENARKFYKEVLPTYFNSENMNNMYNYIDNFFDIKTRNLMLETIKEHPSINMLGCLLKYIHYEDRFRRKKDDKEVKDLINEMLPLLDKKSVNKLTSYFKHSKPLMNFSTKSKVNVNSDFNFLNYEKTYIKDNQDLLMSIDKDFKNHVLNKNIILEEHTLNSIIYQMQEDKDSLDFFRNYFALHKDNLLQNKNLIETLIKHPLGHEFVQIRDNSYYENQYQKLLVLIDDEKEIREQISSIIPPNMRDGYYPSESYEKIPGYKELNGKVSALSKEQYEIKQQLSFDFVNTKVELLIKNRQFKEYNTIREEGVSRSYDSLIETINNYDFNTILKCIEDKDFVLILDKNVDSSHNTEIKFKYTSEQNAIIAEMLLPHFKDKTQILAFFKESNKDFLNEFIIKHLPIEMFYSYKLRPPTGKRGESLLPRKYTNEEILRGFNNAEKAGGFFSEKDNNASYDSMIKDNYTAIEVDRKDKNYQKKLDLATKQKEEEYKKMLEIAKKENPKLYLILAKSMIFQDFLKTDYEATPKITMDQAVTKYFKENFDLNVIVQGMKMVVDDIKNQDSENPLNHKLSIHAISTVIFNTYYEEDGYRGIYKSPFSTQEAQYILKSLFKESPILCMGIYRVGTILSPSEHIKSNFAQYFSDDKIIEDILYPNYYLKQEYFKYDNDNGKVVVDYMKGMIDYYMAIDKPEVLDYLKYTITSYKDTHEQLSGCSFGDRLEHSDVLDVLKEKTEILDLLDINARKFSLDNLLAQKKETQNTPKRKKI